MYTVCQDCAIVILNNDDTHLSEDMASRVSARLLELGNLTPGEDEAHSTGVFTCDICGEDDHKYAMTFLPGMYWDHPRLDPQCEVCGTDLCHEEVALSLTVSRSLVCAAHGEYEI